MQKDVEKTPGELVVAISSRALFDLEEEHRLFEEKGYSAFRDFQLAHKRDVLKPGGIFVLEYANKRNALEIARCLAGRSGVKPFDHEPSRRSDSVYYNFHPKYVEEQLKAAGFVIEDQMAVSLFRSARLKKAFGKEKLTKLERPLQHPLGKLKLSPSVFLKLRKV